ncbi:MAG: twin-arginine translocase TatA/TatE family subunit [Acidobacteria bacterium]|nr:twin-arginine translocase TatA/TatE family subunit [Acidobacteriota bacterium]
MPTLGPTELIIILVIVILIFGVNKIPKLGKGLGEGIRNFKTSLKAAAPANAGVEEPQSEEEKS